MTTVESAASMCLHQLVEWHADRTPAAPAIEFAGVRVSYDRLDSAANALARTLRERGVKSEVLVGIYGPLVPELIVGVLAVLKAGGAFLPLDAEEPLESLRAMLEDAACSLVLAARGCMPEALEVPVLGLEPELIERSARRAAVEVGSHDLAYAIFTSGSTGRRKAVMIEHHNIVNYVRWAARAHRIGGRGLTLPAITRFTADASMQQVLAPLARGGLVWLVSPQTARDPSAVLDALCGRPGSGLHCVPSLWEECLWLLEHAPDEWRELELSALFLGGELVRQDVWERTRALLRGTQLANVYGPTETTVQVTAGFQSETCPLSVGWPIDGAKVYVLDARGRRLGVGERGEVYIGGAPVGRGYLGGAELTASVFVPDPFSGSPSARMYRSGDRGEWLADGSLRVLGRVDEQLKIRGFRIEPAAIEAVLCAHASVRRAAVVALNAGTPCARLRAAIVPTNRGDYDERALRDHLGRSLPEYMRPADLVCVAQLPRTGSGKLDRRALASRMETAPRSGIGIPRTPIQDVVGQIWESALGVSPIALDDDFFGIGGHSLLVTRVLSRIREAFGVKLKLRVLYDHPTLGALSAVVERELKPSRAAVIRTYRERPMPLSLQQEELYASFKLSDGTPFANVLVPITLRGPLDVPALRGSLSQLVARHALLRTVFRTDGVEVRQQALAAFEPELAYRDLSTLERSQTNCEAVAAARELHKREFDLTRLPLIRFELFRLSPNEHLLLVALPHLLCDGQSLRALVADLAAGYERALAGKPVELPAFDYPDFVRWQHEAANAAELFGNVAYWSEQIDATPRQLAFVRAIEGPRSYRFQTARRPLAPDLVQQLRSLCASEYTTPFIALAAALAVTLRPFSTASDVRLGTLVSNREPAEFDTTVGPFANTVALCIPVGDDPSFATLLRRVRNSLVNASMHQGLPFERVVARLAAERGVVPGNLFDACFTVETPGGRAVAAGVSFEQYRAQEVEQLAQVVPNDAPISVTVVQGDRWSIAIEYDEQQIAATAVHALLEGYARVLRDVVSRSAEAISAATAAVRLS